MIPYKTAAYLSIGIPFIILLISIILGIEKIFKKIFLSGVLQIISTIIVGAIGLALATIFMLFYPYDHYANNLDIPSGIALNIPKDTLQLNCNDTADFEISRDFQPGLYSYAFCYAFKEKGIVYLRAFEISHNDPLSSISLQESSTINVMPSDKILHYQNDGHFTIYEGDWGHPYAARFELWFRNDNGTEIKLTEKNYQIEGWMR